VREKRRTVCSCLVRVQAAVVAAAGAAASPQPESRHWSQVMSNVFGMRPFSVTMPAIVMCQLLGPTR
jgi:hypothetical protein